MSFHQSFGLVTSFPALFAQYLIRILGASASI